MSKIILPYLKPMIQHELGRMKAVMQAHKALVEPFFDSSVETDRYIDIAVEVISNALEKGDIKISSDILRAEISQEYNIQSIKDVTGLNSFTVPTKTSSLEEAAGVLIEELSSTSSVSMASDGRQLKGVSDIPGFILKTEKEVFG